MSDAPDYATLRGAHGRRRIERLTTRCDYLARLIAARKIDRDRAGAELSALRWLIAKAEELRDRLDKIVAVVETDAPALAEAIRALADEQPEPGKD